MRCVLESLYIVPASEEWWQGLWYLSLCNWDELWPFSTFDLYVYRWRDWRTLFQWFLCTLSPWRYCAWFNSWCQEHTANITVGNLYLEQISFLTGCVLIFMESIFLTAELFYLGTMSEILFLVFADFDHVGSAAGSTSDQRFLRSRPYLWWRLTRFLIKESL